MKPMCRARHAASARSDRLDRKSTRLNSSHLGISYAVFCLKKKKKKNDKDRKAIKNDHSHTTTGPISATHTPIVPRTCVNTRLSRKKKPHNVTTTIRQSPRH